MAADPVVSLELRLKAVLGKAGWLVRDVRAALRKLPSKERKAEAAQLEQALQDTPAAGETVRAWKLLHERRSQPNGSRLTPELRGALLTSIASRHRTWLGVIAAVDGLLALPDAEAGAAHDHLLAAPPARLDRAHSIYLAAARVAPPEALPRTPPHQGGPTPQLSARGYVEAVLVLAREVFELLPPEERPLATTVLELVGKIVETRKRNPDLNAKLLGFPLVSPKVPAMKVFRGAVLEARQYILSPDKVGSSARPAAKAAMEVKPTAALLVALDDELCRSDCATAVERQKKELSAPVTRAIWRAADAKGKGNAWLMELADGHWALLQKLRSRWVLTEGLPDDVLATVPAERFEAAVRAAQPFRR